MTSGKKLSQEQYDRILSLAGEVDADGEFCRTYEEIAELLGVHRRTVYRAIRQAAVQLGALMKWREQE